MNRGDELLHSAGIRPTAQRRALVASLHDRPQAVTAQELHLDLVRAGQNVGLTTVYRTLAALAEAEVIDVFDREGEQAVRLCRTDDHHHHLECESCGRIEEIDADAVETWVASVGRRHGYEITSHHAEITGLCPTCSKSG